MWLLAFKVLSNIGFFLFLCLTAYYIYRFFKTSPDNNDKTKVKAFGILFIIFYVLSSFLSFF